MSNRREARPRRGGGGDGTKTVEIVLNGEKRAVPEGQSLSELLASLGLAEDRVAIEFDRRIVRRPEWPATALHDGATVEIVQFVGGG